MYRWQVSTNGGKSWGNSNAGGYATAKMSVVMTGNNPGYLYRCKITDSYGNVVYSEPGEIKVAADVWEFTYNADGLRTSRTNGYTTYEYVYHGSQLSRMTVGSQVLTFGYDASGTPLYVIWNGSKYFYTTNLQGDVVALVSTNGNPVVYYTYDAWGNILSITGTRADNLGKYNPLRYRGYVYDQEIHLYYLQSRYYDPEWGRFLNADAFVSTGQGLLGNNMFAYCRNNPVSRVDVSGLYDLECEDVDPIEDELVHEDSGLGGGGQSASSGNITSGQSYSGSPGEGSTTIYRYGYAETGPKKLVPTNQDLKNADNSGLSFSTKPRPGSAMTTIDAVNSTGVLYAVQDGTNHVSVYPIGGTLADWYAAGYTSKWTEALVDIVQISPEMEISQK